MGRGLIAGLLMTTFLFAPMRVSGSSMSPAFHDGDLVVLLRPWLDLAVRRGGGRLRPGDVVAFRAPGGELSLKRVVVAGPALVEMRGGVVTVDGEPGDPAPEPTRGYADLGPTRVTVGEVFLLGDDRRPLASRDSRAYGPVPAVDVIGRVVLRVSLP